MLYVLIMICLNGAQGCTYDAGHSVIIGSPGEIRDQVVGYDELDSCQKDADRFNAIYNDPDLFEVCREVAS
jgi:hypothetical protein